MFHQVTGIILGKQLKYLRAVCLQTLPPCRLPPWFNKASTLSTAIHTDPCKSYDRQHACALRRVSATAFQALPNAIMKTRKHTPLFLHQPYVPAVRCASASPAFVSDMAPKGWPMPGVKAGTCDAPGASEHEPVQLELVALHGTSPVLITHLPRPPLCLPQCTYVSTAVKQESNTNPDLELSSLRLSAVHENHAADMWYACDA